MIQTPQCWFKVNVDDSFRASFGRSTCGGLVCDTNGKFVKGFYGRIGSCYSVWAEQWTLRLEIKFAQQLNVTSIIFELDSTVVVNMIQDHPQMCIFIIS